MDEYVEWEEDGATIRGMLKHPRVRPCDRVVIFLHGWAGDRTGPNHMFVDTAAAFAEKGWASLRFDFRGRGDSDDPPHKTTIASMTQDAIGAVHFALKAGFQRTALLGICSGCKVAIAAASNAPEIREIIMWSAETMGGLRTPATRLLKGIAVLKTYLKKLRSPNTWRKILLGRINTRMIGKAVLVAETPDLNEQRWEEERLRAFSSLFNGRILFLYGSYDPEFKIAANPYRKFCANHRINACFHTVQGATHSFYSLASKREVIHVTVNWLENQHVTPETDFPTS